MAARILVIRGGAIGDFILTLPALKLLRETFTDAHIEVMGYRHVACLAENRFYSDATRSIDYAPMAGFFNPRSTLDPGLVEYFSSFHQVVSYIYDPDELFAQSLKKAGVKNLICGSPKVLEHAHAAVQLAQPLEKLALWLDDPTATFFPNAEDLAAALPWVSKLPPRTLAIHAGSGSASKNWPMEKWGRLLCNLLADNRVDHLVLVGGENDAPQIAFLRGQIAPSRCTVLENLALPLLGTILSQCPAYMGHDTGISHLAAAAGTRCLLLYGPTDPAVWAPKNAGVTVLRAPNGSFSALDVEMVRSILDGILSDAY